MIFPLWPKKINHKCHSLKCGVFCACLVTSDEDAFTVQHSSTGMCLVAGASANLSLAPCDPSSGSQLWKWGSAHRLFHMATSRCLAMDVPSKKLSMVDCGTEILLQWRCREGVVYTIYQMGLMVSDGKVVAKRDSNDTWVRGGSQDNICQRPYRGECGLACYLRGKMLTHCRSEHCKMCIVSQDMKVLLNSVCVECNSVGESTS